MAKTRSSARKTMHEMKESQPSLTKVSKKKAEPPSKPSKSKSKLRVKSSSELLKSYFLYYANEFSRCIERN